MRRKFLHLLHLLVIFIFNNSAQAQDDSYKNDDQDFVEKFENEGFIAVSSKFFHRGKDYKIFVIANDRTNSSSRPVPIHVKGILMDTHNQSQTFESQPLIIQPEESAQLSIPIPEEIPGNEKHWQLFTWDFDPVEHQRHPRGFLWEAPHQLVSLLDIDEDPLKSLQSIFVRTDKPVYKPDDLVQIRVVTLGLNGLPHNTSGVNLTIWDSAQNVMQKWLQPLDIDHKSKNKQGSWTYEKKRNGLRTCQFKLSSNPALGNWTIFVQAGKLKKFVYFNVQEYVLPGIQVNVAVPPLPMSKGDVSSLARIVATCSFGKMIQGSGNLTVRSNTGGLIVQKPFILQNGKATVPIKLSSSIAGALYTIVANVSEKNTGRWQVGKTSVSVDSTEQFFVQWLNKPAAYKPGFPMKITLLITGQDGLPIRDIKSTALQVNFPPALNHPTQTYHIPAGGKVDLAVPTPFLGSKILPIDSELVVIYRKITHKLRLPPPTTSTPSGVEIVIVSPSTNFVQGQKYDFVVESNKPIQPPNFYCILWNEALLEVQGSFLILTDNTTPTNKFPFSMKLPTASYTKLMVIVYFEHEYQGRREIISTSNVIETSNFLKIRVTRPIPIAATATVSPAGQNTTESTATAATMTSLDTTATLEATTDLSIFDKPPGDPIQIHFETYPESTIAIRGIDQSLLLMADHENDLKVEKLSHEKNERQTWATLLDNVTANNSTPYKNFGRLGICLLNSKKFSPFTGVILTMLDREIQATSNLNVDESFTAFDQLIPKLRPLLGREPIPDTWLWEDFESSSNNNTTVLSRFLPATLTSWVINGFSLNSRTGLACSSPATVTGYRNFFVTLNMPYSVVKLEAIVIEAFVHNFLGRDVLVHVTLVNKAGQFAFLDSREQREELATRPTIVLKDHVSFASFVILPTVIGDISIDIEAVTADGLAGDQISRPLKVEPNGVKRALNTFVFFPAVGGFEVKTGKNAVKRFEHLSTSLPPEGGRHGPKLVSGSSYLTVSVVGNPTGTLLYNLANLIKEPGECRESDLMCNIPSILTQQYLTAANVDAPDLQNRAQINLQTAYGRFLQYRKSDGSFALVSSAAGSTWLTAYLLRWLSTASSYIQVDDLVISKGILFILKNQRPSGEFTEPGPISDHLLSSRTNEKGTPVTAFITLCLIHVRRTLKQKSSDLDRLNMANDLDMPIQEALNFISRLAVYDQDDNYVTNLVAATLMVGNQSERQHFFDKMEASATKKITNQGQNLKYWDMLSENENANKSMAIEMTSYALLAHLWRPQGIDNLTLQVSNWLLMQQKEHSQSILTQKTVMELTALTEFAVQAVGNAQKDDELRVQIRGLSPEQTTIDPDVDVTIADWNRVVRHEYELPVSTKSVQIEATGTGPAIVQLTQTWYEVYSERRRTWPVEYFDVQANVRVWAMSIPDEEYPEEVELSLCVNTFQEVAPDSIASIDIPSGYFFDPEIFEPESEFMLQKPKNVVKFEISESNTKLDVYYTSISPHPKTCITVMAIRGHLVADVNRPSITVYEYLEPNKETTITYTPPHMLNVCQLCQQTDACDRSTCG